MEKETGRIEAFSDGVFAIAITLLILDVKVPRGLEENTLTQVLFAQWPTYAAFLVSFVMIGVAWLNHHYMFTYVRKIDHTMLILNLLLLLGITIIPFPTSLLAEYLQPHTEIGRINERTAAIVYNGIFIYIGIVFNLLWRYAASVKRLFGRTIDNEEMRKLLRSQLYGVPLYIAILFVGLLSVPASLILNFALAIFYGLPQQRPAADASSSADV